MQEHRLFDIRAGKIVVVKSDDPVQPMPDPADMLAAMRAAAVLSRAEFCVALKRAGILSVEEAKQAAQGSWPASFAAALSDFPDADEAEIIWAAISTVERMHPMLLALQEWANTSPAVPDITDAALDAMFGITAQDTGNG